MAVLSKAEIAALTHEQRLALIEDLWESFDQEALSKEPSLPAWQRDILDERLSDLEMNPSEEITLAEARSKSLL